MTCKGVGSKVDLIRKQSLWVAEEMPFSYVRCIYVIFASTQRVCEIHLESQDHEKMFKVNIM